MRKNVHLFRMRLRVGSPCPPVRNNIVTRRQFFFQFSASINFLHPSLISRIEPTPSSTPSLVHRHHHPFQMIRWYSWASLERISRYWIELSLIVKLLNCLYSKNYKISQGTVSYMLYRRGYFISECALAVLHCMMNEFKSYLHRWRFGDTTRMWRTNGPTDGQSLL